MDKPIDIFVNKMQAYECLEWWQHKLFLDDWTICLNIDCMPSDMLSDNVDGENEFEMIDKACVIRILDPKLYGKRIIKFCAERILVHELLHCKYNWLSRVDTVEGKYYDTLEHQLLEETARSLIMAKYNIDFDYFIDIER